MTALAGPSALATSDEAVVLVDLKTACGSVDNPEEWSRLVIDVRWAAGVAEILVNNPPVNALGHSVRTSLLNAISDADADPAIKAIVIRCEGRTFFAGADISEFGQPPVKPTLADVILALDRARKPVIAAIHGNALGGGLELALACHCRIATKAARLGLPEVKLGILPGAGGTQRLPRLVGVPKALEMVVFGAPIDAVEAQSLGLVDALVDDESQLAARAQDFAAAIAAGPLLAPVSQRQIKLEEGRGDPEIFSRFRETHARALKSLEAPNACISAIEAAVARPFAEGLAFERELFLQLVATEESRALRHLFFAERAAAKIDDMPPDTPVLPIRRVGIVGAGTMGTGIAMNFLTAGVPVTLVEREQKPLDHGVALMRRNYEASAKKGRFSQEQIDAAMALLTPSLDMEALADCDLLIEAVFELMSVKKDIFRRFDAIAKPEAILASNTSYLDVNEMAGVTRRPESVVGMHFFSPANVMKLLEVVRGDQTSHAVLRTVMGLAKRVGKVAVVSGVCHGFIGNRMLAKRQEQAAQLVIEGALPWEVDQVLLDFGLPMGPFQMSDLAGLDVGWTRENSTGSTLKEVLCEADRRGQKNGRGFYDYDEMRNRRPSPEVVTIVEAFRARLGVIPRQIGADEIRERLLYPLVNEGALILEEGIAQRASDIDVVWINGYGWPKQTGGPMHWADAVGHETVADGLWRWRSHFGPDFRVATCLGVTRS